MPTEERLLVNGKSVLASIARRFGTARILTASFLLTVLAIAVLIGSFVALTRTGFVSSSGESGNLLEGVMSLMATAIFIGAGVFALFEYVHREQENSFSLHHDLITRMMSEEESEARAWIMSNIRVLDPGAGDKCREEWIAEVRAKLFNGVAANDPEYGRKCVRRVLNSFDYLGLAILKYWRIDEDVALWLAPMVTKIWSRIGPYIEYEAERRGEKEIFYRWARKMGNEVLDRYSEIVEQSVMVDNPL